MRYLEITRRRGAKRTLLLAVALAVPASTSALPTDGFDFDAGGTTRRADVPSASSVWEGPASAEPVVTVRPPEAPSPEPEKPERILSPNPLWEIPLAGLSSTRERPIFSPSRRPPPPAVIAAPLAQDPSPAPKPQQAERPQLSLVGTIAGGGQSIGIFVDQTTEAALRLKLGEDYQGWKLQSVQGREVTLERDQQTTILSLPQPGTSQPPGRLRARTEADATPPAAIEPVPRQRALRR